MSDASTGTSAKPGNVMIDIETMGKTPGSQILSIGTVVFYGPGRVSRGREWIITSRSSLVAGFTRDEGTIEWWDRQAPQARKLLTDVDGENAVPLAAALAGLAEVVAGGRILWSKGVGFDFPILEAAYLRCGWGAPPWHYRQLRCYRTLAALRPEIEPVIDLQQHGAVNDAIMQANHAAAILAALGDAGDF